MAVLTRGQAAQDSEDSLPAAMGKGAYTRQRPNMRKAWETIASTTAISVATLALLYAASHQFRIILGQWACFAAMLPFCFVHGGSYTRVFMLFHDGCHGSFSPSQKFNRYVATITGFVIAHPAKTWRSSHNQHHAHLGNTDIEDDSLTVFFGRDELDKKPVWFSAAHRVGRDPITFYLLIPIWMFWMKEQPYHLMRHVVVNCFTLWVTNWDYHFFFYLTLSQWMGGLLGVVLFHLQHQANVPYRKPTSKWDLRTAAFQGSTYLYVPECLKWITLGIEYHHIHHENINVPCYGLRAAHESLPDDEWKSLGVNFVMPGVAFRTLFHTVFTDETHQRFGSFWIYDKLGLTTEHDASC